MNLFGLVVLGALGAAWWKLFYSSGPRRRQAIERLRTNRPGEGFEAFAAAAELRTVDPRIVKGVWDGLQDQLMSDSHPIPLRASDHLDDFELDQGHMDRLIEDVLTDTNRVIDAPPPLVPVVTIGDLMRSIHEHPPRRAA